MSQSNNELWDETLEILTTQGYLGLSAISCLKKSSLFKIDNDTAYISYRANMAARVLDSFQTEIEGALSQVWGSPLTLQKLTQKEAETMMPEEKVRERTNKLLATSFNPSYTFESFVEGSSNQEAYAAALGACHTPAIWNPLMVYGNSGLGKTHLLNAVGNYLKVEKPEVKIIYMYAGDFVTLLIDAMKTKNVNGNTVEDVKEQLLDCDYFLIDDIQNLNHTSSQEIFFTVYNKLISKHTQIILTSDIHPAELQGLESRLVSRFRQGLAVNISKPSFETSKAILKKKVEGREDDCQITDEVLDFLAMRFSNDVRSLEGSLNRLIFNATMFNPEVIDMAFATQTLQMEPASRPKKEELSVKTIKKTVAQYYGFAYKDLEGKSRQKELVWARHIIVYFSRTLLNSTYKSISEELGSRDHSTLTNSFKQAESLKKKMPEFAEAMEDIRKKIES